MESFVFGVSTNGCSGTILDAEDNLQIRRKLFSANNLLILLTVLENHIASSTRVSSLCGAK